MQRIRKGKYNDEIMTPLYLAKAIVHYFGPQISGSVLEPCSGTGNFVRAMYEVKITYEERITRIDAFDVKEGSPQSDFFNHDFVGYDWIITNPPFSKVSEFLRHSLEIADNVVFLMYLNKLCTNARMEMIEQEGFGIKEILRLSTPKEWTRCGMQLTAIHLQKGYAGDIKLTKLIDAKEFVSKQLKKFTK